MRTLQEESLALDHVDDLETRTNILAGNEDSILNYFSSNSFGPCCPSGCQYCRPNCYEKSENQSYF